MLGKTIRTNLHKEPRSLKSKIASKSRYKRTMDYIRDHQIDEKDEPKFRKLYSYGVL